MEQATILWRRLDKKGFESARLTEMPSGWQIEGTAVFVYEAYPCRLDYRIDCGADWQTRAAQVTGWVGGAAIDVRIAVDASHHWQLNDGEAPGVAGCTDLDLNFSPSTNLLPVRRLGLTVGQEQPVRAAWLRFPEFTLEPLDQRYLHRDKWTYRYQSADGSFVRDLTVAPSGFVLRYPGFWEVEAYL
jgi:hypothetical protein